MKFVAHGGPCTCLSIGQKSGHVLVTGGDDKKVNLWAIGKPNVIMVTVICFLLSAFIYLILRMIRSARD
jgi:hypothetical protein